MNVDYINLENGKSIITNENGEMIISETSISGDELLIKNKIENIDNKLAQLKKKILDYECLIFVSKSMLISQIFILIAAAILGHVINGIYGLVYASLFTLVMCGVNSLCWGIVNPITKRKLNGTIAQLEKAKDLKLLFEEELVKEKKEEIVKDVPISLKNKNSFAFSQIDKDLNEAYYDAIHSKPKKLTLKK